MWVDNDNNNNATTTATAPTRSFSDTLLKSTKQHNAKCTSSAAVKGASLFATFESRPPPLQTF